MISEDLILLSKTMSSSCCNELGAMLLVERVYFNNYMDDTTYRKSHTLLGNGLVTLFC